MRQVLNICLIVVLLFSASCIKVQSKTRFFTKALEELIKRGVGGRGADASLNEKCYKFYQFMLRDPKLKGPAGTMGRINEHSCCSDAQLQSSKSGVSSINVVVARTLYVDGCTRSGWKEFKNEIKSQFSDVKSDLWGTILAIAEKI
jgi:hypothetical protein